MNIVFVTRFYPPDTGGGGIAAYAYYLATGLRRTGHQVTVISQMAGQSQPKTVVDGVEVLRIRRQLTSYRLRRLPIVGRYTRFAGDLFYSWRVRNKLIEISNGHAPDIVEYADIDAEGLLHPFKLSKAVVKLHTPHFVLRQFYTNGETPYDTRSVSWIEKRAIIKASGLSSPSCDLAKTVAREYDLPESRIYYVPNLIDTDFFSPGPHQNQISQTVLYAGRLEALKGAVTFARAIPCIARQFPSVRFVFAGADRHSPQGASLKLELMNYFEAEGIAERVEFSGHGPREEFREHYRGATVFAMPSLFENCPYTLLEAMSCGKPVVVSKAFGMKEMIVDGESGLFFRVGDSGDLAEKVICLLTNEALREKLGKAARKRVLENYSMKTGVEKTIAFYSAVLEAQD
jgi:glycosyltransferase involved in cell wall biosynthesis